MIKNKHITRLGLTLFSCVLLLSACDTFSQKKDAPALEGTRMSIMELQRSLEPDATQETTQAFKLPEPWKNAFWPQAGGYPNHAMQNVALSSGPLERIWKTSIGRGANKRIPLTAPPIVVDGHVFTLDTNQSLRAFTADNGKEVWKTDVTSQFEDDPVIPGGIAYGENKIFVTNGYNEVAAIEPKTGEILWRKAIPTPSRAAPTVLGGRVFVITLDNRLLALAADNGAILWEYSGITANAGLIGAASPGANIDSVVPVFSSGEISALRAQNGSVAWSDNLSARGRFGGLNSISDIRAMPVLDKGIVYAASFGGKLVAIDGRTGARIWQREIGSAHTPWVAGNTLFVLSTNNELVALNRADGTILWVSELPAYEKPQKRSRPITWTGPLMAAGKIMIAGSHGTIQEINPANGEKINQWNTGKPITLTPIIAGETLYIVFNDGTLSAYR